MRFDTLTIFPDFFRGPLDYGIVHRARQAGLIEVVTHDLRAFTHDRHRTVDDRPFGGGEGMVLKPEPIFECMETLQVAPKAERLAAQLNARMAAVETAQKKPQAAGECVVLMSASGAIFNQQVATELSQFDRIVLICGRYEGIDERVAEHIADRELSVGDFVLSGGELPAAIIIDAVTRLVPGALGNEASAFTESFSPRAWAGVEGLPDSTAASGGLLDYPHYTRPADYAGLAVPEVLLGGNHDEIRRWRRYKALEKTLHNRPDLLQKVTLSSEDKELLDRILNEATAANKV
ncbi:MAG TPA: tRNA (guanosine(37)-N1)-methyltransferase TrmD [Terriglobales bacterium]|nr:tRNA (guanosine(37)-N1)-methyltransferase TrmD [Terriglobales bacterium]